MINWDISKTEKITQIFKDEVAQKDKKKSEILLVPHDSWLVKSIV